MLLNCGVGEDSWDSWTSRRSNQSIRKEINPEYSLKGLMLKLKLQYFDHPLGRTDSFEKTLMLERLKAGGEGDYRGWDGWMASLTWWTWVWASSRSWWWTGEPGVLQSMGSQRVGHDWMTEQQQVALVVKNLPANAEFSPWVGKIPWSRNDYPLQYSCLESPTDRGAWWARVHGVAKSQA